MVVGQQCALTFQEIQKVGHLLEVGRHIGVVTAQMHIVELNLHDMGDAAAETAARARLRRIGSVGRRAAQRDGEQRG